MVIQIFLLAIMAVIPKAWACFGIHYYPPETPLECDVCGINIPSDEYVCSPFRAVNPPGPSVTYAISLTSHGLLEVRGS